MIPWTYLPNHNGLPGDPGQPPLGDLELRRLPAEAKLLSWFSIVGS